MAGYCAPPRTRLPDPIFIILRSKKAIYLESSSRLHSQHLHHSGHLYLVVFAIRGICDYLGDYFTNFVGFSAVKDFRNEVFDKVLRHGAAFFEATSTGRLMSSVMNDIDKIQIASSDMFADLLRQSFLDARPADS